MTSARSVLWAGLAGVFLLGCAEVSLRAPDVGLRNARLVFMPSMVALYRIEGCNLAFDELQSRSGRARADAALQYYASETKGRLAELSELAGTDPRPSEFYEALNNLARAMFADGGRRPLGVWDRGPFLAGWATALNADYLVFVLVRGSLEEGPTICGSEIISPLVRAGLIVVELKTGRVVRFRATRMAGVETRQMAEGLARLGDALDLPAP
jgi:hypothetical protein